MADLATLQTYLAQAEDAYHQLNMGANVARIRHNEREMSFNQASAGQLAGYIADLNARIARVQAGHPDVMRRGRSRSVFF